MKRDIQFIVVHCTATTPDAKVQDIVRYWTQTLGWKNPGYHYLIKRDGQVVQLQDESKIANGVKGNNEHSIHVSYIGGVDREGKPKDNRTPQQQESMFEKLVELSEKYPKAKIVGHRDFPGVKKACPSFDVRSWLASYEPNMDQAA
ncbi:MAG: N-acetylmuramoyl-L-alanine amidase [Microcystis aeruginosa Ma_QC_Ca_00000000_S207]|uniref:N-acetylmuramoyl-L-alanine amidase n=1 Tax=Microcystis aeruginosa Ma_QC_Ca_00000000_S207 TaxID=2486251 RepID=A0A552FSV0_MICAE|nr:MAG: N-acetylmuramoyl-L-alanine amidase [Microcystis aeruginosa Ma_QC_Ca_00000000_S207]